MIAVALMTLAAPAAAQTIEGQDTVLVDAAAAPRTGTTRASAGGGAVESADGLSGAAVVSVQYTAAPRAVVGLAGYVEEGKSSPSAFLRYQILDQERLLGVNLAVQGRFKTDGFEGDLGGEAEASVNVGRRIGGFDVVADAVVGREIDKQGMDGEGKLSAGWSFGDKVRAGFDARYRQELVHEKDAVDPGAVAGGREFDLLAGPTIALHAFDRLRVQALAGLSMPRGTSSTGGAGLVLASFDF
jgi:hypothetical protein